MSMVAIVSKKPYLYSKHAIKVFQLTTNDITIGGFLNLLVANNYDKYQFSQSGQGCRYWVYSVANLLLNEGKITDEAQIQAFTQAIRLTWGKDEALPTDQQTPIVEGRFFALGN